MRYCSHGELIADGFAILDSLSVVVEEVNVEAGLHESGNRLRPAEEALSLVSVDPTHTQAQQIIINEQLSIQNLPVQNVEEAIEAEARNVMTGEVLNNAHLVKHNNLGDEGESLEPKRETPGQGPWGPTSVKDASQNQGSRDQSLPVRELITELVVSRAVGHLVPHQIDDRSCCRNEKDFHGRVVEGNEVEKEIFVAHEEDKQVDLLCLARET